jgi:triacylglycerol lipase
MEHPLTTTRANSRAAWAWHWLSRPPLLESRAGLERIRLTRDPVFRGVGVPRGRGQPVLLIPGFLAGDWSLSVMARWLQLLGYRPFRSGLRVNQYASEATLAMLTRRLQSAYASSSQPVTVIGHSRGGMLAVVLAHRQAALLHQVITLGSPIANPSAVSPLTLMAVRAIRRGHGLPVRGPITDHPRFEKDLATRITVPTTSIYSRSDAIVDWHACVRPDVTAVEVRGSHVGLGANRDVFRLLAQLLPGVAQPAAHSR